MGTSRAWSAGPPAITDSTRRRNEQAWDDLVTDADRHGLRVDPVVVARGSHVRSPMLDAPRAAVEPTDDDGDAPMTVPLGAFVTPVKIALVIAVPLLLLNSWQVAVAAAFLVLAMRELQGRFDRHGITFGGGFLAYRPDPAWPQGVQEDDAVRWRWAGPANPTEARR